MAKYLVTGANRGLGLCLVRGLLDQGEEVFACRRRPSAGLKDLVRKHPGRLREIPLDVSSETSVRSAFRRVSGLTDALDGIVNNAAIYENGAEDLPLERVDIRSALRTFCVNSLGPLTVLKHFFPLLAKGRGKTVLNISSEAGSIGQAGRDRAYGYCMSKAALNMQSKLLANYGKEKGIRVLVVHPGWLRTDMGGKNADLDPAESAAGLLGLLARPGGIEDIRLTDHTGKEMSW